MIEVQEHRIGAHPTEILPALLTASSKINKGDRPADLVFKFEGSEVTETCFAELRFDKISNQLAPLVEISQWQNIVLVMGIRKWLIFTSQPLNLVNSLHLHRHQDEDTGFYSTNLFNHNDLLIAIYESGAAAISSSGMIVWHRKKHWDDKFVNISHSQLVFLTECGQTFAFDCSSGKDTKAN